jgi:hypothetical protein
LRSVQQWPFKVELSSLKKILPKDEIEKPISVWMKGGFKDQEKSDKN